MKSQACRELMSMTAAPEPPSAVLLYLSFMYVLFNESQLLQMARTKCPVITFIRWRVELRAGYNTIVKCVIYSVGRISICRRLVRHQFLNRKQCQSTTSLMFHFIFGIACETCCTTLFRETLLSLSVKYLEGDCWLRALALRQRLLQCTGSSVAHRLPVGMDVCIHFGLCTDRWIGESVLERPKYKAWNMNLGALALLFFVVFGFISGLCSFLLCFTGRKEEQNRTTHSPTWVFM